VDLAHRLETGGGDAGAGGAGGGSGGAGSSRKRPAGEDWDDEGAEEVDKQARVVPTKVVEATHKVCVPMRRLRKLCVCVCVCACVCACVCVFGFAWTVPSMLVLFERAVRVGCNE
jgi:hypothetical protein